MMPTRFVIGSVNGAAFAALLVALLSAPRVLAEGPPVSVAAVEAGPVVRHIRASGSVTSPRQAELSAAVAGLIEAYFVDIGDSVDANARLVQLDDELAELELQRALAGEQQAHSALDDARRRFSEAESLSGDSGVIAATEVESRRTEVAVRKAELAVAEAEVRLRRALLARHNLRAPFAGVVSQRLAEIGEWTSPGVPLLELVATAGLQFDFRLSQDVFAAVTSETSVVVEFDALPGVRIPSSVQAIVPVKNPNDRTFLMRAVAAGPVAPELLASVTPGMSAQALIAVDTGRRGVIVPRDALLRYADGRNAVWVVNTGSGEVTVSERHVKTGLEFDGQVEIVTGLEPGLKVVVRGNEALREGQPVVIR